MKILHSWLMEFIDAPLGVDDLVAKLNRLGLNVEGVESTGASFSGVVVGRILSIGKHPNADKLSLCEVDHGQGVTKVVCGAKNIAEGQKIPFAKVGASLSGMVLKKARIRGVESEGMICSAGELGLKGFDNSGILVLPDDAPLGADAAALFEKPDHILEVEVTPNLAYCLSHYALARELCAFYGLPLKRPSVPEFAAAGAAVPIKIVSPDLCRRYTGIVVENILPAGHDRPAATPDWMASRLRAMGANPKNNVLIDVSNYVMYELGQPAHCFDRARLSGPEIIVRPAREGETLRSLDGQDLKLDGTMLVIADRDRPAALAGVIGGLETAVSDGTSSVLIESASFSPSSIRSASRKTGVKTESSYRFERGTDPELTMLAARRLAQLILAAAPGAKVTQVTDNYPSRYVPKVIEASAERINAILGTEIAEKDIFACLKAIQPDLKEGSPWRFPVPSYRQDMETVWDLAEEAARHIGYEVIPSRSGMRVMRSSVTASFSVSAELKERFAGLGFSEIYNYDLVSRRDLRACMLPEDEAVPLKNPLSSDHEVLRTSLAPGILKTLRYNLNRGAGSVSVFEVGNVYRRTAGGHREETMCAGLMYGAFPASGFWRGGSSQADLYLLKGAVVRALEGFGPVRFEKPKASPAYMHHAGCLEIKMGGAHAGWLGLLSPEAAANSDLKDGRIYCFELPMSALAGAYKPEFRERVRRVRPVTAFPGVWRDLSVVIADKVEWADIEKDVSKAPDLSSLALIDVYKGKNIGEGLKSLTIRFTFSSMERTLTDTEINSHMNAILAKLSLNFGAKLRA